MAGRNTGSLLNGETVDLTPVIELTSREDTPFLTMLQAKGVVKAKNINPKWRQEALNAAGSNAHLEGSDAAAATSGTRKMLDNNCQILKKTAGVTGSLEATDVEGVSSELNRDVEMRVKEIKMDLEVALLAGTKADEDKDTDTPRTMDGLINMVANVVDVTDEGGDGVGTLTKKSFEAALKLMWDNGVMGANTVTFMPPSIKTMIIDIHKVGKQATYTDGGTNTLGFIVEKIITDFGTCNLVMNRHMSAETIVGVNMDFCELAQLRPATMKDLITSADKKEVEILWEPTLKLRNEYAGFKIIGIKKAG